MATTVNMQKRKYFPFMRSEDSVFDMNTQVGGDCQGYSFWLETITDQPRKDYKFSGTPRTIAQSLRPLRPPGSPPRSLSQLSYHDPVLHGILPEGGPHRESFSDGRGGLPVSLPHIGTRQFGRTLNRLLPHPLKVPPRREHNCRAQTFPAVRDNPNLRGNPNLYGRQERGMATGRWIPAGGMVPGPSLPKITRSWG